VKKKILKNGLVYVDEELKKVNILIIGEKIVGISESSFEGDDVIDCKGKWILPGCIDPHVHFRCPGMEYKEDWITGSQSAVSGGVTTVLDMPNTNPPTSTVKRLLEKRELVKKDSIVNYGFHFAALIDNIEEIENVKNIASVKVYFGSSTGNLLVNDHSYLDRLLKVTKYPICFHAENEEIIKGNEDKYRAEAIYNPLIHGKIRSEYAAEMAVREILELTKDYNNKIYFCHTSTRKEIELIEKARASREVYCEATPHHIFLNEEILKKIGNYAKVNPPLRKEEDRVYLYNALLNNKIDTIGSDHAPHNKLEKENEYFEAPSGMPGVATLVPLLLSEVYKGKLSISQFVKLTSNNTATIFSIRNKGEIKLDYDADIIVVNPNEKYKIKSDFLFSKANWSPYENWELCGRIEKTFVLGNLAFDMGKCNKINGKEISYL